MTLKRLIKALFWGVPCVLGGLGCVFGDTTTTRLGLTLPDIHSPNWGTKNSNNFSILDTNTTCLGCNNTLTGSNVFQGATTLATTTISSSNNPQLAINNTNFAGPFLAGVTFGFNGSPFSYFGESNANQLCSDFTTICSVDALQFGPTSGSPHFAIDVNGKIAIGTSAFSKSTATVSGNMLIGSGYPTVTNAPVDGLKVKGQVQLDSLTASVFTVTDASKNLASFDLLGANNIFSGADRFSGSSLTYDGILRSNTSGVAISFTDSSAHQTSLTVSVPAANRNYTLPDLGTDATFSFLAGTQTHTSTDTYSGAQTFTGTMAPPSKTKAQLNALAPASAGLIYYCSDCATDGVVVSTGTATGAFGRISARTTAIN